MSIYSIMAFNAAADKMRSNTMAAQDVAAKKVQTETAQQELDLNKQLNQAKIKQARNEGLMSDYIGDALEKQLNEQHKAKADQLDAISGLQDIAEHKAQVGAVQAGQMAAQLHAQDPDVQAHVATLSGIMQANGGQQSPPMSIANPGNTGATPVNQQPDVNTTLSQPETPPVAQAMPSQQMPQPTTEAPAASPESSAPSQAGGLDLSPVETAMGMPKGSLWLNPQTMKPDINPIWKSKMEATQRAQANYDINQPFREEQRQDKNVKTAETYLVNALKQRGGAIGLQNSKVDAAIHARALINQAYDPATGNYNVSQVPYGELSESMGALLSGQSGTSEGRIAALKQRTAQGDVNGAITYLTGKPSNATSQDAIKQLVSIIDRQGEVSEELRDKAFEKMKQLPTFSRLNEDAMQGLKDTQLGNSFKEELAKAPDKQPKATAGSKDYSNLWK